jgi:hypothetical protein
MSSPKVDLMSEELMSLKSAPLNKIDEAWVKEAEKRFAAWRRGQRKGVSAKRAFKQIQKDLNW